MTVTVHRAFTSFTGDSVQLFRAMVLKQAIKLLQKGITPSRGMTMTKALAMCETYTGQAYKRTESDRALTDLTVWIELMKSATPVQHEPR